MLDNNELTPEQQAEVRKNLRAKAEPYSGRYRYDDDEDDTPPNSVAPANGNPQDEGRVDEGGDEPSDPEEKSWKKRHGDLRRIQQKERTEYDRKLKDMSTEIEKLQKGTKEKLPRSEEEIKTWMEDHPDLASMVLYLADKAAGERTRNVEVELERVREDQLEVAREKAYLNLKKLHPDVDDIRGSAEFHAWVDEQPDEIKAWFYDNETNHILAAKGIDIYKREKGLDKKKPGRPPKADNLDNSQIVTTTRANGEINLDPHKGKKVWRESEVAKMSQRDFERLEDEIDAAIDEGRFIQDLTNASA